MEMLDKKQIWAIFLFEFKTGSKAVKTTHNINNAFGPGTDNEYTLHWWFEKLCKGDKSFEGGEHSDRSSKVDTCNCMEYSQPSLWPWDSSGKNTGVGYHSLLQGIFLTQESNSGLLHSRQILYHLSHQGSPLQWPVESSDGSWFSYNYIRSCPRTQHQPFYGH